MKNKTSLILVVDDERDHADGIVESLAKLPVEALAVYNAEDALQILDEQPVDVVLTDLRLEGDLDGLAILKAAKHLDPSTEVILMTAYATIDNCKEAMRCGAYDYLVKPIDIDQLRSIVAQATEQATSEKQTPAPMIHLDSNQGFVYEGILGTSPVMRHVIEVTRRVAKTNISVLIEGESGTGKELLARAIHMNSPRSHKVFQPVNCAGLTETLLESELFGHTKGAFTGAATDRKGFFEVADGGTLFLDEIGDMPLSMQAKLLRVLEDGLVVPVGATKPIVVDVRIISATNQNFQTLIEEKNFREDLYFRIKGVNVTLPALRQRPDDIPALLSYFLQEATNEIGSPIQSISPAAMRLLEAYEWPGNVRQLRSMLRTMVVMCDSDRLDIQDLPPEVGKRPKLMAGTPNATHNDLGGMSLSELERQAIADTLTKTEGNREKAAKILGIGERTLYRKIKEYNL
ncbi:sigma-54-dependent transcriptional regulator [Planctomycetota bacterium]